MVLGKGSGAVISFGGCLYATPIGEHFYRISIQYRERDEEFVVLMVCGECLKIWEKTYKENDTISSTIKCPYCGLIEEVA